MTPFRRPTNAAAAGDPIPFAHDGKTHLFYLSSPAGTQDYPERVRTTWQHAVSENLVDWDELVPALEPGEPGSYDGGGIWTGSVVEKDGTFYLFYTGHHVGAENPQTICLATSDDLTTFTKHPGNPVVLPTEGYEPVDWRDPYVFFNEDEHKWWMLIAARRSEGPHWRRGCIVLATSDDLLTWTVEQDPLYSPGTTYCPECPEMWKLDGTWYLVFSTFSERVSTIYRTAASSRGPFRTPADDELGGRRFYAAKSAEYGNGRVFFGWVHDRVIADGQPRWLWGGDFASPRIVETGNDASLQVRAAPGVMELWGDTVAETQQRIGAPGTSTSLDLADTLPESARISVRWSEIDAASVGIQFNDDELGSGWRLEVIPGAGSVRLTREPQPLDDFWADLTGRAGDYREVDGPVLAAAVLPRDATPTQVSVDVVFDGAIFEAYINDQVVLSQRLDRSRPIAPAAFVSDGTATITATISSREPAETEPVSAPVRTGRDA